MKHAILLLMIVYLVSLFGCETPQAEPGCGNAPPDESELRPVVFVHGMAGSAEQFSLQAQRFASNGYPDGYISGFEYDTTLKHNTMAEIMAGLDAHINAVIAKTGAQKIDLAGHSMGTTMSQRYLFSSEARAAKVAHYVNIDGMPRQKLPGGVPTLAVWAAMTGENRNFTDAANVTLPAQTHVQACTSAETFFEMYKFFTGNTPETVAPQPENSDTITLAGQLNYFSTNLIPENYLLDIYEVTPETGVRISETPLHSQAIGADGSFEFNNAAAGKTYEFATHSPAEPNMTQHFYTEPFIRSSLLIRLLLSEPDSALTGKVETGENHTNLTVVRDKELVGDAQNHPDQPLLENDGLTVNGEELCSEATTPARSSTIGLYVMDDNSDGQSHIAQSISDFALIPFVNGIDLFIPASTPPDAVVSVVLKGRQNGGRPQMLNVPNWPSETDKVTVKFHAY